MFGNILEMLFSYKFLHFLSFQTNFISENPPYPKKIHHYPHKTHHHTTQKPPKHHHPHHHNNNKKNQRSKRERLRDWGKERSIFSGSDKIGLGWVENEIGLGWWWREWDARLRSRWWRSWGKREKKEEAWLMCDLGSGAAWSRRWGGMIWASWSLAGLAKAWLRWKKCAQALSLQVWFGFFFFFLLEMV